MDEKINALDFLKQLKKLDKMIANKLIEIEQWKAIACGTTAQLGGERVQSSSSQQKMADAVDKCVDMQREINDDIDKLVDTRQDVIHVIEQLPADEYDLLHKIHVQYLTIREAGEKCGKEYGWAKKTHRSGVKQVQKILDERG